MSLQLQLLFNKVALHLKTQSAKAIDGQDCKYLTDDGRKCAVGCLIDAAHYSPSFEGNIPDAIKSESAQNPDDALGIFNAVVASQQITFNDDTEKHKLCHLLRKLQAVHDNYDVDEWPLKLQSLAFDLNLQYAP